jgi:hypothetical protein
MNYPTTMTIDNELEHQFLLRARCISMFSEVLNLADENMFGKQTEGIDSVEGAELLLADLTVARDALQRVKLRRPRRTTHLASSGAA